MTYRLAIGLALAASACSPTIDDGDTDGLVPTPEPPCIEVDPGALDFGSPQVTPSTGDGEVLSLTITNDCPGDLALEDLRITADDHGVFELLGSPDPILGEGDDTTVRVEFEPPTHGQFTAWLTIDSNDPARPQLSVLLVGSGIGAEIDVTPDAHRYGAPYIGCEVGQRLRITNPGNDDLVVTDVQLFTASVDEFRVDLDWFRNGDVPYTVGPYDVVEDGPSVDIYLDYRPLDTFRDDAFVSIASNDPYRPEVIVEATGEGTHFGTALDTFVQPIGNRTDILFTLDRSSSMVDNLEPVIENFDRFVATLQGLDSDYHAAVVVDDGGCVLGPDGFIDSSFSKRDAIAAFRSMADVDFALSGYGSNTERGFMVTEAALSTKNIGTGGCNAGFYRDDAFLSIVHVSDEPEQSVNSWSYYVALFQSLKASPEDVKINAVAGDYPSGCGSASAGTGYYEATVATGGLFLSICSDDWASSLEDLAAESVVRSDSFELTHQPVPQTIEVKVDGVRIGVGWEYWISSNSIVFERDHVPSGGSVVEVSYQRMPDCEG